MSHNVSECRFLATNSSGEVTALLTEPAEPNSMYVFAHGAGANMRHSFMEDVAFGLADRGVATLRYNFPYMEGARRPPNRAPILVKTVRSAVAEARRLRPDLPCFAGGKSMGGRMTSTAQSKEAIEGVLGIAFFGFPLHPSGKPGVERAEHLSGVSVPMLFLQGTRDKLAGLDLLRPVLASLNPEPELHVVEGADHGFHVLKRSGRTDEEVLHEMCDAFVDWSSAILRAK